MFGRKPVAALVALTMATALATTAQADLITTYTFSNTTVDGGGVLSGSFQVDQTLFDEQANLGYVAGSSSIEITGDSEPDVNGLYTKFRGFAGFSSAFESGALAYLTASIGKPPQQTGLIIQDQTGFTPDGGSFQITGMLLASTPTADTPEPSTWAMMLLGFAGLGFVGWQGSRRLGAHARSIGDNKRAARKPPLRLPTALAPRPPPSPPVVAAPSP